ncbi:MAG: hypothetical protein E7621_06480 [Ruminococcaceae bacterium]|nr:hypothetical protein [Oscillospiraceae bacterium]
MDSQFNEKLKNILSDPESVKSLLSIASAFGSQKSQREDASEETAKTEETAFEASAINDENIQNQLNITDTFSSAIPSISSGNDDRIKLLLSIKPFLNEKKKSRVDGLVKALGAARIISSYKDLDLFS